MKFAYRICWHPVKLCVHDRLNLRVSGFGMSWVSELKSSCNLVCIGHSCVCGGASGHRSNKFYLALNGFLMCLWTSAVDCELEDCASLLIITASIKSNIVRTCCCCFRNRDCPKLVIAFHTRFQALVRSRQGPSARNLPSPGAFR